MIADGIIVGSGAGKAQPGFGWEDSVAKPFVERTVTDRRANDSRFGFGPCNGACESCEVWDQGQERERVENGMGPVDGGDRDRTGSTHVEVGWNAEISATVRSAVRSQCTRGR